MKKHKIIKREPTLADRFLANGSATPWATNFQTVVRDGLMQAKRFVLDDSAIRYCAEMIREVPEAVVMAQEFAIRPFPIMYIEVPNFPLWFETIAEVPADPTCDTSTGYLYIGPDVYVLAESTRVPEPDKLGTATLVPLKYRLNRPFKDIREELNICEVFHLSRAQLDSVFWGGTYPGPAWQGALRENHSIELLLNKAELGLLKNDEAEWQEFAISNAGDLRNIIALLLFLNRAGQATYLNEIPMNRQMVRNKPRTLLSHSVVMLDVARAPAVRKVFKGMSGGGWKREHDVRGHFCIGKTARESVVCNGIHSWVEYDVNQWKCTTCGGLKWWRKDCRRGTRDKGRVHTTYEVKASAVHTSAQTV